MASKIRGVSARAGAGEAGEGAWEWEAGGDARARRGRWCLFGEIFRAGNLARGNGDAARGESGDGSYGLRHRPGFTVFVWEMKRRLHTPHIHAKKMFSRFQIFLSFRFFFFLELGATRRYLKAFHL